MDTMKNEKTESKLKHKHLKGWNRKYKWKARNDGYGVLDDNMRLELLMNESLPSKESMTSFDVQKVLYTSRMLMRSFLAFNGKEELCPLLFISEDDRHIDTDTYAGELDTSLPIENAHADHVSQGCILYEPHQKRDDREFNSTCIDEEARNNVDEVTSVYLSDSNSSLSFMTDNINDWGVEAKESTVVASQPCKGKFADNTNYFITRGLTVKRLERAQFLCRELEKMSYHLTHVDENQPQQGKTVFSPELNQGGSINAGFLHDGEKDQTKEGEVLIAEKGTDITRDGMPGKPCGVDTNFHKHIAIPRPCGKVGRSMIWSEDQLPFDLIIRDKSRNQCSSTDHVNEEIYPDRHIMKKKILEMNEDWQSTQRQDVKTEMPFCAAFSDLLFC